MGKPIICICENKGADQLRGNLEADQRLCFRYSDSTIPPLLNSKISSFVQAGLCQTCSETTLLVFLRDGSFFVAACPDISCSNNGTLEQDTCQCDCVHGFTGLFCQTRRFAYNCGLGCTASNLLRNNVVFSRNSILLYTAR